MSSAQDKELQQYRDLVQVPSKFEEGFGIRAVIGALFLGMLMIPGSIYMQLFMGQGLGPAARWVTVILFAEVAKRSMKSLKKQEVYILFYMTGIALATPFSGLLWSQYLISSQSVSTMGIEIPGWIAPPKELIEQVGTRTFFHEMWLMPALFFAGQFILSRIDHFGLGYVLYRITAHVEKLPFPMAPVGALGVTALAEAQDKSERWRWRWFSMGGALGLGFGLIYIGVPAITGAILSKPIQMIPVPWLDLTSTLSTREMLPATAINLVFDLGLVIVGMVLPFWAVIGGFIGLVTTFIVNPVLYKEGVLTSWTPGSGLVDTVFANMIDFYLSFSIGLALAIFVMSVLPIIKSVAIFMRRSDGQTEQLAARRSLSDAWRELRIRNKDRGDISVFLALGIYVFSTISYIIICLILMPGTPEKGYADQFPWLFFLGFGFIYQPVLGYVNAKLEGLVGQTVQIPLVREAAYILSGYTGSAIWFAPVPLNDYGSSVQGFRVMELTGTKLTSVLKTELVVTPIVIISSLFFWDLIWRLAPVPSEAFPFAQEFWELQARNVALQYSSTLGGSSMFIEAIKPEVIGWGTAIGLGSFAVLNFLNLPTLLIFGVVRGFGQTTPGAVIPEVIGALIGRFYLERKYGHQNYKRYVSILLAGYGAGVGLVAMASVAFALIAKSTSTLGY